MVTNDTADISATLRFAVAEGLVRLSMFSEADAAEVASESATSFSALMRTLLGKIEATANLEVEPAATSTTAATTVATATVVTPAARIGRLKSNHVVLLLVLLRQFDRSYCVGDHSASLSVGDVKNILAIFLRFIKEKDAFTQDIACLGICQLYHIAGRVGETDGATTTIGRSVLSLAEYVAYEVTVVLTRQKRATQPAGYSVAGEASA